MVPAGSHVRTVYLHPEHGILSAEVSSKIFIDCSTIDISTSRTVCNAVKQQSPSSSFYDAPVSGGSLGAAKATVTFLLGCNNQNPDFPLLQQILGMMGSSIFPCGGPTLGLLAKICNNYCSGLIAIATAEALNIGMKSGMNPRILSEIFRTSTAQSTINDKWNPVPGVCPEAPSSHGYQGGFKVQLMKKDFSLAVAAADEAGARLMLGESGLKTYFEASDDERCRNLDSRVVFRLLGGDEDWESRQE